MSHKSRMQLIAKSHGVDPQGSRALSYKGSVEGLSWNGADEAIASFCEGRGLRLLRLDSTAAGWLRSTTRFQVHGPESSVYGFLGDLGASMDDYENPATPAKKPGFWSRLFERAGRG